MAWSGNIYLEHVEGDRIVVDGYVQALGMCGFHIWIYSPPHDVAFDRIILVSYNWLNTPDKYKPLTPDSDYYSPSDHIVVVKIDNCPLPTPLQEYTVLDATNGDVDVLADELSRLLGAPPEPNFNMPEGLKPIFLAMDAARIDPYGRLSRGYSFVGGMPTVEEILAAQGYLPPTSANGIPSRLRVDDQSVPLERKVVFISYARKDGAIVDSLINDLRANRIVVWVDNEQLEVGTADWEREIRQNIVKSNGLIYVATEDAAASQYVRDELAIARDNHIPVYPIWVRGIAWSNCIPLGWGHTQYVDGRGNNYASAVQTIIATLKQANSSS